MATLPVFVRVGDGEEVQIGKVEADSAADMIKGMADFYRGVAEELDRIGGVGGGDD